ncbi:hypothetical protein RND71_021536 [Anisodus tanguticus]|uniref:Uncharacterized protein n=1 Tax=Anisodus tanguticus TaxID=243964 RepID=A0AAE1RXC6_9SOLA|nr:hypothetical protein RND71_021536 [Anisodus tanguticus]
MKLHDLLPQCLAVIFTVILIARISSCLDTEVLNEVSERVDKQSQDVQLFLDTCSSGVGPCTLCNIKFAPKLSALHRKLIGEGSHQRLSSSLRLKMSSESTSGPPKFCERGVFRDAAVFGDTNLELPSFLSNRSLVEVHLEVGSNLTSQQKDELEIHMDTSSTCTLSEGYAANIVAHLLDECSQCANHNGFVDEQSAATILGILPFGSVVDACVDKLRDSLS